MGKGSLRNKKQRQDEILGCLRSKSFWTCKELSERISVSQRTLMRDLAELQESGIPIEAERGRGGGLRLNGRWGIGRLQLSSTEVISLLISLVISETLGSPILLENLNSIRNRISAAFPQEQRTQIEQLRARIFWGGSASGETFDNYNEPNNKLMPAISECFIEMKKMQIEYQSEKGEVTARIVEPQILLLNWPIWYLVTWDELREDVRMFRIDRITSVLLTTEAFTLRKRSDLLKGFEQYFDAI